MPLPNFIVIGAHKSGTTSLYFYLKEHPEVYMSPVKEPRFFAFDPNNPEHHTAKSLPIKSMEAYRDLFSGVKNEKAVGEVSPNYLHSDHAARAIRAHIPDVKLLVSLRNPVHKTVSLYSMRARAGNETRAPDEALRDDEKLLRSGLYYEDVRRYNELFGRDRVKVLLFEDLEADALGVMKDVYGYIGVDDQFQPNVSMRHNTAATASSPFMREAQRFYRHNWRLRHALQAIVPYGLRQRIAGFGRREVKTTTLISADMRRRLSDYYREDIIKLQDLIDRDLSAWLKGESAPRRHPRLRSGQLPG